MSGFLQGMVGGFAFCAVLWFGWWVVRSVVLPRYYDGIVEAKMRAWERQRARANRNPPSDPVVALDMQQALETARRWEERMPIKDDWEGWKPEAGHA